MTNHGKRWVVRDRSTLRQVLANMGEGEAAITEGRVFVGRKRADSGGIEVKPGEEVRVGAPAPARPAIEILFERDGIIACVKPAGTPSVPDHAGSSHALVNEVARVTGEADLRVTSRLDREVSGVVLFAATEAAENRLKAARAAGRYDRRYLALATAVEIDVLSCRGTWDSLIGRGRDPRHRAVGGGDAQAAETRFRAVATADKIGLFAMAPITGRTHQIRVHAAAAGLPLLGDRDYGGVTRLTLSGGKSVALSRIALHCARVVIDTDLIAEAAVPLEIAAVWSALGGAAEAWNTALQCDIPGSSSSRS